MLMLAFCVEQHEHHKLKSEGENSGRHKLEEEAAAGLGMGAVGYALYEHHEKKKEHKEMEELEKYDYEAGKHREHGWFRWLPTHIIGPTYPCSYDDLNILIWENQSL